MNGPVTLQTRSDGILSRPDAAPRRKHVAAELVFRRAARRTFLAFQRTPHPFHITRPFYFPNDPDGMASLYLQSSSGGLYGDDHLTLMVTACADTAVQVTTQASTIVHAARGGETRQDLALHVEAGAYLEYLPDPVILFGGARLTTSVRAAVEAGGCLLMTESFLAHDPDGLGESFEHFESDTQIFIGEGEEAAVVERMRLSGKRWAREVGRQAGGFGCFGILYLVNPPDVERAQDCMAAAMGTVGEAHADGAYLAVERHARLPVVIPADAGDGRRDAQQPAWKRRRMAPATRWPARTRSAGRSSMERDDGMRNGLAPHSACGAAVVCWMTALDHRGRGIGERPHRKFPGSAD